MRPAQWPSSVMRSSLKMFLAVFMFCAVTAISSPAQTLTTLYSFCSQTECADGADPWAGLVQGADGNLYGTTFRGGTGLGTAYKITTSGTLTSLHSFNGTDGLNPAANLVLASDGNYYGTTPSGGNLNLGNIFKMTPSGTVTQVYSFCTSSCPNGAGPLGALVQGADGNFYGVAQGGGDGHCSGISGIGCGTVFKVTPSGTLTVLHTFTGPEGADPYAGLVLGADGNFYGTTQHGGMGNNNACGENSGLGCGTVFRITPGGTLTTLYNFCSLTNCVDGYGPQAGLIQAADGNFYGTAHWGGAMQGNGNGTIFRITSSGGLTTLHSFAGFPHDGSYPLAGVIQATDGNFYGTTSSGGTNLTGGTVYQMTSDGSFNTLYNFCSQSHCVDGSSPYDSLLEGTDGNLYGTTTSGGTNNDGTVFQVSLGLGQFVTIQPTSGAVGTAVTILGTNLSGATAVTFNGTPATILTNTGSAITTTVPTAATTGTVQVALPSGTLSSNADFQVVGALQFVPATPCRLVDTRSGNPIQGGTFQSFTIPPLGNCGIPASAAAYSLNVTVVPHGPLGYLTIWPEGEIQPFVSTMNSPDGRIKANAAIVPAGNNAVSVYVTDTTDVILDIDGYFTAPGTGTLQFYPVTPCRVVDTRQGSQQPQGLGPPSLGNMETRQLPILATTCPGLPAQQVAYSLNVTVVPSPAGQPEGYISLWPSDQPQPVVSTLNNPTATVVANAAIVPAAPDGSIKVFAYNSTDLLIDINGFFAPPGQGSGYSFYPVVPCRTFDSRNNNGQPFTGEIVVPISTSPCAPPASAGGYVFNATVVPTSSLGYLTLWPDGSQGGQPVVSTLNAYDGFVTSNLAIVPNINGSTDVFAGQGSPGPGSGYTQLILDISGYFAQ
jgi:uncharacterized repeat protein (TIGR03803 family)